LLIQESSLNRGLFYCEQPQHLHRTGNTGGSCTCTMLTTGLITTETFSAALLL